jgi:hypothetical protein
MVKPNSSRLEIREISIYNDLPAGLLAEQLAQLIMLAFLFYKRKGYFEWQYRTCTYATQQPRTILPDILK